MSQESTSGNQPIGVEFAVEMTCDDCKQRVEELLKPMDGVKIMNIDVDQQKLLLELQQASATVHEIQSLIESKLGMKTVIKGFGGQLAAVSEIQGRDVMGVVRLTQMPGQHCLVDGVVDGVEPSKHCSLNIHQYGDLSGNDFENVGDVFIRVLDRMPNNESTQPKRSSFKLRLGDCDLSQCIGRSMAVSHGPMVVGAGIVARASTVGDNRKKICACSGKTLWDERNQVTDQTISRL